MLFIMNPFLFILPDTHLEQILSTGTWLCSNQYMYFCLFPLQITAKLTLADGFSDIGYNFGFIFNYQMLFLVQDLVLVYAVILYLTGTNILGTLISINYWLLSKLSIKWYFSHTCMLIFCTVLRMFYRQELLVTHSVSRICKHGFSYSILYEKGIGITLLGIFFI